jgi:hypothetical protein
MKKCSSLLNDLKYWLELTGREIEKFTGDTVLISEESLKKTDAKISSWSDLINKILYRHSSQQGGGCDGDQHISHEKLFKVKTQKLYSHKRSNLLLF